MDRDRALQPLPRWRPARDVENGSATSSGVSKSAKVVLVGGLVVYWVVSWTASLHRRRVAASINDRYRPPRLARAGITHGPATTGLRRGVWIAFVLR